MFLESQGSLSPVQFISRCVSSVRVQANGTIWSTQKGCLPTRQPLLRVCSGACSSLCHSGSQAGGKDSVLRTDLDPEDTDWTLRWDVPAGSPRILTQVGMGPLAVGMDHVKGSGREPVCHVQESFNGSARGGSGAETQVPGARVLSSMQSADVHPSETPCGRLKGSGL